MALAQHAVVAALLGYGADPGGRALRPHPPAAGGRNAPLLGGGAVNRRLHTVGRGFVAERQGGADGKCDSKRTGRGRNPSGHSYLSLVGRTSAKRAPARQAARAPLRRPHAESIRVRCIQ